jgi:hypothetical protein
MSRDEDFSEDPKQCFYDCNDQLTNIVMMHEIVEEGRKLEKAEASKIKKEEKLNRRKNRQKIR